METASVPKKRHRENVHKRLQGPRKIRLQDCIYPTTFKCLQIKKNQFFLVDLILAMALAKSGYVGLYRLTEPVWRYRLRKTCLFRDIDPAASRFRAPWQPWLPEVFQGRCTLW